MDSVVDLGETDCEKYFNLPGNARVCRCNFSLEDLSEVKKADLTLITSIITYVCYKVAKRDKNIEVYLCGLKHTYRNVELDKYTIRIVMPKTVTFTSLDLNDIHKLDLEVITDGIKIAYENDAFVLEIGVYSKTNPYVVSQVSVCHMRISRLDVITDDNNDDVSEPIRRKRKMTR
jgi:hypothetical protein